MAKSSENLVRKWIHPRKIEPFESTNQYSYRKNEPVRYSPMNKILYK